MAMFTTPPSRRLAYHLDGSVVNYWYNSNSANIATSTQMANLNDEEFTADDLGSSGGNITSMSISVFFPVKYDIYNYFLFVTSGYRTVDITSISVSSDTTNGLNGTWTILTTPTPNGLVSFSNGETGLLNNTQWFDSSYVSGTLTGATGIRGIKIVLSAISYPIGYYYFKTLNLWGVVNDSSATQRVQWSDNTGTPLTADKLYTTKRSGADIIGGQYLKNLHTNAASQIVFSVDGEQSTVTSNVTISVDGGTTFNALPYVWTTSLASGAVSSEIKVKYTVPSDMAYGYKYYGITATPTFV